MEMYKFCMYLGFTGIVAMALLSIGSLSHGVHGGHLGHDSGDHPGHGGHGHSGHAHGGHVHGSHVHGAHTGHEMHGVGGHAAHGHVSLDHHHGHDVHGVHEGHDVAQGRSYLAFAGRQSGNFLLSLLSPRVFFSLMLGFGATGMVVPASVVPEPYKLAVALGGGFGFEHLFVAPLWNFMFRFASNPARTLETAVAEEAQAVTNFDASGCGLISIDLDGQIVQVLGKLNAQQRRDGTRVRTGDRLFVEAVDTQRNSCTVSLIRS